MNWRCQRCGNYTVLITFVWIGVICSASGSTAVAFYVPCATHALHFMLSDFANANIYKLSRFFYLSGHTKVFVWFGLFQFYRFTLFFQNFITKFVNRLIKFNFLSFKMVLNIIWLIFHCLMKKGYYVSYEFLKRLWMC